MKKLFANIRQTWYRRLSDKIEGCIPKEYDPLVVLTPSIDSDKDMVVITLHIPHNLVKKLMWSMKVWRTK